MAYGVKQNILIELQEEIIACQKCPRLVIYCERIAQEKKRQYRNWTYWGKPMPSFGDPDARVLVVGLAPAAHGGNRTGRMFTGDKSGDFLYQTLHRFGFANQPIVRHRDDGLALSDLYITAVVRCAPPDNKPTKEELANCYPYFLQELDLLKNVRIVVALGGIAFDSCLKAFQERGIALPRPKPAFGHGYVYRLSDNLTLVTSYHPSRHNTQTGRLTEEMFDAVFEKVRGFL
jgi:uracil-DNA glycosylase family 4